MKVFVASTVATLLGVAYAAPASSQMGYGGGRGANSLMQGQSSFSAAVKEVMGDNQVSMKMYSHMSQSSAPSKADNLSLRQMSDRQMSRQDMAGGQMSRQRSQLGMSNQQMNNRQMSEMEMSGRQMDNQQMPQLDMFAGLHSDDMQMPRMDMSDKPIDNRQMSDMEMSERHMDNRQMSDMKMSGRQMNNRQMPNKMNSHNKMPSKNMARSHQQMSNRQMPNHKMSGQQMSFDYLSNALESQSQGNQYYKQDQRGNYVYGYSSDVAEKFEEGNAETGVKGHYTFVDANGVSKRVDYIADKEGFRIIHDNNNKNNRFNKRDADLVRTRLTSYKDMSLLMDDDSISPNMFRLNGNHVMNRGRNLMGQNMMDMGMSANNRNLFFNNVMSPYTDMRLADTRMMMMTPAADMRMYSTGGNDSMMSRTSTNGQLLGQRDVMAQRMEVERIDDSLLMNRMFL